MALRTPPEFLVRHVTDTRYFFLDLHPDPELDLVVVGGGCERCLPAYRVSRSDFPYYSLEYVLRGRGTFTAQGRAAEIGEGSICVYGPGMQHEISTDPRDCLTKYFVDFDGLAAPGLLEETGLHPGRSARVSIPRRVMELCESMLQNGSTETPYNRRVCATLLEFLILKCAENIRSDDGRQSRAYSTYLRCRQHLEEHYLEIQTLDEVARRCHLEKPYLCRLFKQFDRDTAYQRLIRLKMSRAAELLSGGDRLVKEVADAVGYDDPYHFSRVFKKTYGMSPVRFLRHSARLGRVASES